jgi:hypothetical protein
MPTILNIIHGVTAIERISLINMESEILLTVLRSHVVIHWKKCLNCQKPHWSAFYTNMLSQLQIFKAEWTKLSQNGTDNVLHISSNNSCSQYCSWTDMSTLICWTYQYRLEIKCDYNNKYLWVPRRRRYRVRVASTTDNKLQQSVEPSAVERLLLGRSV